MPATSEKQRRFFAGWEHNPEKMRGKRPEMTRAEMHEFSSKVEKKKHKRKFGGKPFERSD